MGKLERVRDECESEETVSLGDREGGFERMCGGPF